MSESHGMAKKTGYMRLTESFLGSFNWQYHHVTRQSFGEWARSVRIPPLGVDEHQYRPMKEGRPVPAGFIATFSEYLSASLSNGQYSASEIASLCGPESDLPKRNERMRFAWSLGWRELFAEITRPFAPPTEAYCKDENDIAAVATMVMQCVTAQIGKPLTGRAAIACAEEYMGRTHDEYIRWLLTLWQANRHTVLFATQRIESSTQRVGTTVIAPVTEAFYQRFRQGNAEDSDCGPGDLSRQSKYLFIEAVAENMELKRNQAKAHRSMAMANTHLYQFAALCPPLNSTGDTDPTMFTFAGTPEGMTRLQTYNYVDVGTKTPLTGKAVMEFGRPTEGLALSRYRIMQALVSMYQAHICGDQVLMGD